MTDDPPAPTVVPASLADLEAVLPIHEMAFAGTMGVALGRPYLRPFLRSFVEQPESLFLVARGERGPLGYVVGRPVGPAGDRRLLVAVAAGMVTHPWVAFRRDVRAEVVRRLRGLRAAAASGDPVLPEPVLSLVGIGTAPEARGQGVGTALVAAFEDEVTARGFASARLSVFRDNEPARHLYESRGWQPHEHPTKATLLYYAWVPPG
jgi:ribosomal protein S18 acetylase RimI-like enzyme